jgi:ribosome-associated protein
MAQSRRRTLRKKVATPQDSAALAESCARALDDKKAENIVILDLRQISQVADYFVIASGGNPRQLNAMSKAIQEVMSAAGVRPIGIEGAERDRWVLLDYGDIVLHFFDPEWRKLYDLELLWGDAPRLEWKPEKPATKGRKPKEKD